MAHLSCFMILYLKNLHPSPRFSDQLDYSVVMYQPSHLCLMFLFIAHTCGFTETLSKLVPIAKGLSIPGIQTLALDQFNFNVTNSHVSLYTTGIHYINYIHTHIVCLGKEKITQYFLKIPDMKNMNSSPILILSMYDLKIMSLVYTNC